MRKSLYLIFINLFLVVIQTSFLYEFIGAGKNPNLMISFCFSLLMLGYYEYALQCGFISGLLLDLIGMNRLGVSSLVLVASIMLTYAIRSHYVKGIWLYVLISILVSAIYKIILSSPSGGIDSSLIISVSLTGSFTLIFYGINSFLLRNYKN